MSDQDKKMSIEEARHLAYRSGGSVRVLAQLEEIVRDDQTRIVLAEFRKLADSWAKFGPDSPIFDTRKLIQAIEKGQQ